MRARNIKPGFFENEVLPGLPHWTRLMFIGLWLLADRSGRLEDRPAKIHRSLFPGEDLDIDAGLSLLAEYGFISRYIADGVACIQVLKFERHQSPHINERPSILPPMPGADKTTRAAPCEPDASTVRAPCLPGTNPADSLIVDFQSLNVDASMDRRAGSSRTPASSGSQGRRRPPKSPDRTPGRAALNNSESKAENAAAHRRHLIELGIDPDASEGAAN